MKKLFLVLVLLLAGTFVFAENCYKVLETTGVVTYEAKPGEWKDIKIGQELLGIETIKVGLNSILVLEDEKGVKRTIKSASRGSTENLFIQAFRTNGLKKAKIVVSDIPEPKEGTSKGVATASTRASDAKEDFEWDED